MTNSESVISFRKRVKEALVYSFGGKCQRCNKEYPSFIFDFHHLDPSQKIFGIGSSSTTRSKRTIADEAKKCVMVCSNCHRFIHFEDSYFKGKSYFNEAEFFNYFKPVAKKITTKKQRPVLPSREQLKCKVRSLSFVKVGIYYGVSDNAIRKWCIKLNIPHTSAAIKNISDEDWENI